VFKKKITSKIRFYPYLALANPFHPPSKKFLQFLQIFQIRVQKNSTIKIRFHLHLALANQ